MHIFHVISQLPRLQGTRPRSCVIVSKQLNSLCPTLRLGFIANVCVRCGTRAARRIDNCIAITVLPR